MADIPDYKPPKSDAAPRGNRASGSKKPPPKKRSPPKPSMPVQEIRGELTTFLVGVGMMTMMRNETDGLILIGGAPDVVEAWCDLAEKNPYVHWCLQKMCETGDMGKVLSTTIPLALALAANHGVYKGPLPVSPDAYIQKAAEVVEDATPSDDSETHGDSSTSSTPSS